MDNKTGGIVATIVAVVLCGCPGLFSLCFGAITALAGLVPDANIDILGSNDPQTALLTGIGGLCLGIIFVAIPIAVGIFTLRKKPEAGVGVSAPDEPIPPAI